LIDGSTDTHLWAKSYERDLRDVLALQGEVASAIAQEVRAKLTPQEQARLAAARPVDPGAHDVYLQGLFHARQETRSENEIAITLLERATALDPQFALAHASLAQAYTMEFFSWDASKEWESKAAAEIEEALALDANLADAYVVRGNLAWTLANHFPHHRAIEDIRRALALNPNSAFAHAALGSVYVHIGLLDESLTELNAALALDPHSRFTAYRVPRVYLYQQQYERALSEFERHPEFSAEMQWQHALALGYLARRPEALDLIERLSRDLSKNADVASTHAVLLAAGGDQAGTERKIREAIHNGQGKSHFHHAEYNIASAYALLGRNRLALEWLRKTAEDGLPCYPLFEKDPNLNKLRADPEFTDFLTRMRSQWEGFKATL
jgi:tetratricopeptide (TPR) repeat protein